MKQLTINEIAPYIPYKTECIYTGTNERKRIVGADIYSIKLQNLDENFFVLSTVFDYKEIKPILRPLSDLIPFIKERYGMLEHQDITGYFDADFLEEHSLEIDDIENTEVNHIPYGTLQVLLKHHFDIFELIDKGLAIDINTLKELL